MVGQCKFCEKKDGCLGYLSWSNTEFCYFDDCGCVRFEPKETLLESEIVEWMQFVKQQERQTAEAVIKTKRKFIRKDENCIQVEKENGDIFIVPIDDDYLDFATDMLDEFIGDADFNDLAIGDKITFTFIRMADKEYDKLCEESEDNEK